MNTAFLLMAQFGARAVVPLEEEAREYFPIWSRITLTSQTHQRGMPSRLCEPIEAKASREASTSRT